MKILSKTLIVLLAICFAHDLSAQKIQQVKGTETYVIPKNMTLKQAEVYAVKQAKLRLIADEFGTIVGVSSTMTFSNRDGQSSSSSFTIGDTEVKGEWLETTAGPDIVRKVVNNEFVLDVTIAGKVREIISAPIQFHSKVLRNGVTDNCESDSFRHRDYMYMSFQSPEAGYVSIYITDGKDVQCLFPYNGLPAEYMRVDADKKYVFFSKEKSGELDPNRVATCRLGCKEDNEHNRIYLIFSPNKYSKAVDHSAHQANAPRTLSFEEFHNWLSRLRRLDKELTYKPFDIIINK